MPKAAKQSIKKAGKLRMVPAKDYCIGWDPQRETCIFEHKNGIKGEIGCGVMDVVSVFSGKKRIYILSVNYPARYACIESFSDSNGVHSAVFAEPRDITKIFGEDFASCSPKVIAERLVAEMH